MKNELIRWGLSALGIIENCFLILTWLVMVFAMFMAIWVAMLMNYLTRAKLGVEIYMRKRG